MQKSKLQYQFSLMGICNKFDLSSLTSIRIKGNLYVMERVTITLNFSFSNSESHLSVFLQTPEKLKSCPCGIVCSLLVHHLYKHRT